MLNKINEINGKLKNILDELTFEKKNLESSLEDVQQKIDSKIDEAKGYKTNVDQYKANIAELEDDIASYEKDLADLKENYGNKGLDTIVEVGTKEINAKIVSKQKEISKQIEKINELTDRARTIKELLINLKKDKKEKKEKYDCVSVALEYYSSEFEKIISYSEENSETLVYTPTESVEVEIEDAPVVIDEPIDDSPVFDEIESMDKEENEENDKQEDTEKEKQSHNDNDSIKLNKNDNPFVNAEDDIKEDEDYPEDNKNVLKFEDEPKVDVPMELDSSLFMYDAEDDDREDNTGSSSAIKQDDNYGFLKNNDLVEDKAKKDIIAIEDEEDTHFDDTISSLFANQKDNGIDFKTLNDSIDKEYESIFGKAINDDSNKKIDNEPNQLEYDHTGFTELDIFGDNHKENVNKTLTPNNNTNTDIVTNFFITNKIDFDKFSDENKEYIRKIFNPINFTKVLEVLRKNSVELDDIYQNPKVFEMESSELDSMITKLLVANQSIHNISLILSSLPYITLMDLNEVISSFGTNINDANITDIIIKAKHLSDMGKADR